MSRVESIVLIEVGATPRKGMTPKRKKTALARHELKCGLCGEPFANADVIEFDHILPLELGGAETADNIWPLHEDCHKAKTRDDIKRIRKAARLRRDADPETRRKSPFRLRGRGFQKDPLK